MRVLVTGANGFLGRHILKELQSQGHTPLAFVRSEQSAHQMQQQGFDAHMGRLDHAQELIDIFKDIDAVIHAAGGGKAVRPESFFENNVDPTQHLFNALSQSTVKRCLLISSLAAAGPSPRHSPKKNDALLEPISPYGKSKAAAERIALAHQDHLQVGILRPPAIYGPADIRLLPLFKTAQKGFVPVPGGLPKSLCLIHVEDCARAVVQALSANYPSGSAFFVDDGAIHSIEELVQIMGQALHTRPKLIPVPRWLLSATAAVSTQLARLMQRDAWLTPSKVHELAQPHWICDSNATQESLNWKPEVKLDLGIPSTAQWYQQQGWLKS